MVIISVERQGAALAGIFSTTRDGLQELWAFLIWPGLLYISALCRYIPS